MDQLCTDVADVVLSFLPAAGKAMLRRTSTTWAQSIDEYCERVCDANICSAEYIFIAEWGSDLYADNCLSAEVHGLPMAADLVNYWWADDFHCFDLDDPRQEINAAVSSMANTIFNWSVRRGAGYFQLDLCTAALPHELNWLLDHYHDVVSQRSSNVEPREKDEVAGPSSMCGYQRYPLMQFVGRALSSNPLLRGRKPTPPNCLLPRRGSFNLPTDDSTDNDEQPKKVPLNDDDVEPMAQLLEREANALFPASLYDLSDEGWADFRRNLVEIGVADETRGGKSGQSTLPLLREFMADDPSDTRALFNQKDVLFPHHAEGGMLLGAFKDRVVEPAYAVEITDVVGFLWRDNKSDTNAKWWHVSARMQCC